MSTLGAIVLNLTTGKKAIYSVPPEKAVVNAWYQAQGNFNTWEYDYPLAKKSPSGQSVYCGDFVALVGSD